MVVCTINTFDIIAYLTVISASFAGLIALFANLVRIAAIASPAQVTRRHARLLVIGGIGLQILGIACTIPASQTKIALIIRDVAGGTRVFTVEGGSQLEIVQFVHDVDLVFIPVSLNNETVRWLVVHRVPYPL